MVWRSPVPAAAAAAVPALTALLLVACGGVPAAPGPARASTPPALPADCTERVGDARGLTRALAGAGPGATICVSGGALGGAELSVTRSGTKERPIVIASDGSVVRSVTVEADHVVVQGFTTVAGEGVVLAGTGLVARANEVRDAVADGISCGEPCVDVLVEDNTVIGADGSGIIVEGTRITVRGNEIAGSVRRAAGDADGVRFFGTDVRIVGNTVRDIKDDGYAGEPPHTDCFQTYDNSRPPTVGAVVADNICRNVDHQCVIATAEESGADGVVGRSRDLVVEGNVCEVGGSQAVLVGWLPGAVVRGNEFRGPGLDRAAIFLDGSTGATFVDNTWPEGVAPYQLDEASEPGFVTDASR